MSIQPVNKAVEHLINSTPIKNSKGEGEGRGVLSQAVARIGWSIICRKDWVEYYMSQGLGGVHLCN